MSLNRALAFWLHNHRTPPTTTVAAAAGLFHLHPLPSVRSCTDLLSWLRLRALELRLT